MNTVENVNCRLLEIADNLRDFRKNLNTVQNRLEGSEGIIISDDSEFASPTASFVDAQYDTINKICSIIPDCFTLLEAITDRLFDSMDQPKSTYPKANPNKVTKNRK